MRSLARALWAGAVLACALSSFVAAPAAAAELKGKQGESPHGRMDPDGCAVCHVSTQAEPGGRPRKGDLRFGGDIVALCSSCHQGYRHMHPVKIAVAPDMKRPEGLPLDANDNITCVTCHDVMEKAGVHRTRKATGRQLCLNCHVDTDLFAQVNWYPPVLAKGEKGRLEIKVVEFRTPSAKPRRLGDAVIIYYTARDVDTGGITFGTNVLRDDGADGDRVARDAVYTLIEEAPKTGAKRRTLYTGWVMDAGGRRSNTVTLAVEYR